MNSKFLRASLALLACSPLVSIAAPASPDAAEERRRIQIDPSDSPAEIRRKLSEAGVPAEQIEAMIAKITAARSGKSMRASSPSGGSASSGASGSSEAPAAGASASSPGSAPVAAKPSPIDTSKLEAQALENKDPGLAADRKAIEALKQEKALLEAEIALADTKLRAELAPLAEERAKLEADRAIRAARLSAKNAEIDAEKAAIERKVARETAKLNEALNEKAIRQRALETEARVMRAETEAEAANSASVLALRRATEEADSVAASAPVYLDDPVKDGVLYISDRRIPFNGPVTERLADFVVSRLEFYNNKDAKKPVFIVIDNSPGGSVFAGLRILKAMQDSKAPVIVVVKQFAASMAAVTTTMAARSYCYPGTIILHHQMSTGYRGNMTDLRQQQKFTEEIYERTFRPVYTKLGYSSSADFEKEMYAHFPSGDWAAFGDEAMKMKWVTGTVERIEETGVRELPSVPAGPRPPSFASGTVEKRDANGRVYYALPPLAMPGDAWDIYDPEGRFKAN